MKAFVFVIVAALVASTEQAGFSILSPSCTLVKADGTPYPNLSECLAAQSSFQMVYKGQRKHMHGQILNRHACDENGQPEGKCYAAAEIKFGVDSDERVVTTGMLFYSFLQDSTGCQSIDPSFGVQDSSYYYYPYLDNKANPTTKILLLDRGNCSFVTKVQMAQVFVAAMK